MQNKLFLRREGKETYSSDRENVWQDLKGNANFFEKSYWINRKNQNAPCQYEEPGRQKIR